MLWECFSYFQYDNSGRLLVEQETEGNPLREYIYLGTTPVGLLSAGTSGNAFHLTGKNTTNRSENGRASITLGTQPGLRFNTNKGRGFTASAKQLTITPKGNNQIITFKRKIGDTLFNAKLTVNPTQPKRSRGTITFKEKINYSGFFDYPVRFSGKTLTIGATDGSEAKATFHANNTMTLEYDGRSITLTPNLRYHVDLNSGITVFSHKVKGLSIQGFTGSSFGSITITENRKLSGEFKVKGIAGADIALSLYALHTDHLATIHAITDMAQNTVWQGEHDAFGQTYPTTETIDNPLHFPGQYFDAETGLHYNWHRYYNPATGRYISSDPIGLAGGLNTFGYVSSNPLSFIDPKGLMGELSSSNISPEQAGEIFQFFYPSGTKKETDSKEARNVAADLLSDAGEVSNVTDVVQLLSPGSVVKQAPSSILKKILRLIWKKSNGGDTLTERMKQSFGAAARYSSALTNRTRYEELNSCQ